MRVVTHLFITTTALQNSTRAGPIASTPSYTAYSEIAPSSWADLSKAVASAKNNTVYALNPATFTDYTGPAIQLHDKTITINGNGIVLDAKGSGYFFDLADAAVLILVCVTLRGGYGQDNVSYLCSLKAWLELNAIHFCFHICVSCDEYLWAGFVYFCRVVLLL